MLVSPFEDIFGEKNQFRSYSSFTEYTQSSSFQSIVKFWWRHEKSTGATSNVFTATQMFVQCSIVLRDNQFSKQNFPKN